MYFLLYFNIILLFPSVNSYLNYTDSSDYIEDYSFFEIDVSLDSRSLGIATQNSALRHTAIQIIIFVVTILLLILISLLLYTICSKHYRRRENSFFGRRSPSISSIQELIRERLQNRPPSYYESQNSLNAGRNDEPPPYNEVETNTNTEANCHCVYTISSKMPITYVNNDPNLPCMECESDMDSPPSYHTSEGVHNPVLLRIVDNNTGDSERDHHNLPVPQQDILHI